jgi:hypothetical protein
MNCDTCNKQLTEDDTHEHILCSACMGLQTKVHCVRCKSVVKGHKLYSGVVSIIKKQRSFFFLIGLLFLAIACVFPFFPLIAFKGFLGVILIPVIIFIYWLIFPIIYRFGYWFFKVFGVRHPFDISDGAEGILTWLFGVLSLTVPLILYGLGTIVFYLVFRR